MHTKQTAGFTDGFEDTCSVFALLSGAEHQT